MTRAFAAGAVAVALASAALGAWKLWPRLAAEQRADARLSPPQAARAIWTENGSPLPPALYDFWRAHLRRGDRYYVQARATGPQNLEQPNIVRAYAAYWLLPAIQVRRPQAADVVLSFRTDPHALGLPLRSVVRWPGRVEASLARVAR